MQGLPQNREFLQYMAQTCVNVVLYIAESLILQQPHKNYYFLSAIYFFTKDSMRS